MRDIKLPKGYMDKFVGFGSEIEGEIDLSDTDTSKVLEILGMSKEQIEQDRWMMEKQAEVIKWCEGVIGTETNIAIYKIHSEIEDRNKDLEKSEEYIPDITRWSDGERELRKGIREIISDNIYKCIYHEEKENFVDKEGMSVTVTVKINMDKLAKLTVGKIREFSTNLLVNFVKEIYGDRVVRR